MFQSLSSSIFWQVCKFGNTRWRLRGGWLPFSERPGFQTLVTSYDCIIEFHINTHIASTISEKSRFKNWNSWTAVGSEKFRFPNNQICNLFWRKEWFLLAKLFAPYLSYNGLLICPTYNSEQQYLLVFSITSFICDLWHENRGKHVFSNFLQQDIFIKFRTLTAHAQGSRE